MDGSYFTKACINIQILKLEEFLQEGKFGVWKGCPTLGSVEGPGAAGDVPDIAQCLFSRPAKGVEIAECAILVRAGGCSRLTFKYRSY